jgi:hypothetical protein
MIIVVIIVIKNMQLQAQSQKPPIFFHSGGLFQGFTSLGAKGSKMIT